MIEIIAVFKRNNYTFIIEKHSKGYYNLRTETDRILKIESSPDLGELIGRCFDEVDNKK